MANGHINRGGRSGRRVHDLPVYTLPDDFHRIIHGKGTNSYTACGEGLPTICR